MSDQVMMNTGLWPYGLKVMVVEGNPQYLRLMDKLLSQCNYNVIPFNDIQEALSYAVDNQHTIDLVFSDVFLPNEGGLLILKTISLHLDIPIIMTSWCGDTSLVMKYISYGACDFLVKPLTLKELKNTWHHVYRKKVRNCMNEGNTFDLDAMLVDDSNQKDCSYLPIQTNEDDKTVDDVSELKKSRLHWNRQLHNQFISALETLGGVDKAVPRKILEIMRVRELTREHVASHLQKYRLHLKKLTAHNGSKPPAPPQPTTSTTGGGLETEEEQKESVTFQKGETSKEGDSFFSELVEEFSGKHHNSSSSSSY